MKTVLYIDDDEVNKALLKKVLTAGGYKYIDADNGLEGIDAAKSCHPDIILLDIGMPGLDGYETATRIKGIESLKDIPLVALTARAADDDRERGLVAGFAGYMTKPIDVGTFVDTIEKYMGGEEDHVDDGREKGLLRDYTQYLVQSLESKVRELEDINRELEERVEERARDLEKAQNRLVSLEKKKALLEVAGGAAHELNQPLTIIMSLSEVLLNALEKDEENCEMVETIKEQCIRAAEIVKKIGSLSDYKTKKYYSDTDILDLDKSSS